MAANNVISRTASRFLASRVSTTAVKRKSSIWTADNIVKSPYKDIVIPNKTVPGHIWENLGRWSDRTAIQCGITCRSYTYHQLYKYSRNFATKLRTQLGIQDDDVICIMIPNSPEYPIATLGGLEAGAIVTTVSHIYTPYEVQRQITLSGAKVLIGVPKTVPVLKEAMALAKKDLPIICITGVDETLPSGTISFRELADPDNVDDSILKNVKRKAEDIVFLPYSSGTTGLPKGVELTNRNIVVNCMQQDVEGARHYDDTTENNQDVTLGIPPFYHIYGLTIVLLHKLSIGYKIVTMPSFQPNDFINILSEHKVNLFYAAPPLILFLGAHPGVTGKHLSHIKTIISAAAPLPRSDVNRVFEKVKQPIDFLQLYGLTETSPIATAMSPGSDNYLSTGYAVSNTELRTVDSDLKSLGPNEVGELLIRGPQVMKGYRNNPEATKAAITEDGWFKSGDLATIDEKGCVTIADRLKELIKVKGFQVPPAELENVIKGHPSVLDVAVIGVPDTRLGEAPKAFIVLKPGHKLEAKDATTYVAERVAEYKRVKEVMFLDDLPKNPSGKILRRVLKEKYC